MELHLVIAYLDPGTGSFLLQILVAGFLGFLLTLRLYRDRIMAAVMRLFKRSHENP
jgi:hypothetical protein